MRLPTLRQVFRPGIGLACLVGVAALTSGHLRLINPANSLPLFWSSPTSISIVINSAGSPDITDGSHETALRMAIEAWNEDTLTNATLVENTNPLVQARTDWAADDIHMILFDETNSSGYFPGASGIVAVTPVFFYSSGLIDDADIIYNGKDFQFTTSGQAGRMDVQDVGTHELGHLLGLDHSGWAGASMYPYVDPTVILHRSLSADDITGMRDAYPNGTFSTITGHIERGDASDVEGAHVVAVDVNGRTAGGTLSNALGNFIFDALPAGTYAIYASPLDYPVSSANLSAAYNTAVDFESTEFGNAVVGVGASVDMGTLVVDPDVSISLGRNSDDYPLRVISGQLVARTIRGANLNAGSTLTSSDPAITITPTSWSGIAVQFNVTVPGGAAPGHVDLKVTSAAGDVSILTAGLEVTPPNPTVALVSPSSGDMNGGSLVTLTGSNYVSGARVVLGDQIYEDGAPGGCTVVNATTITLTTKATLPGLHDVVVIDGSGVEGRMGSGFLATAVPTIAVAFPPSGNALGGTEMKITGADFAVGCTVTIDGVAQPTLVFNSSTELTLTTEAGVVGGPYVLELTNLGGATAQTAFTYATPLDPEITLITPNSGTAAGGEAVMITGNNFDASMNVTFGANTLTGAGGTMAASVSFIDSNNLEVVTPIGAGSSSVLVQSGSTQQASVLGAGFVFTGGGGGSSGGCAATISSGPPSSKNILANTAWMLCLIALFTWRGGRRRPVAVRS
jgi:hypothetical protein